MQVRLEIKRSSLIKNKMKQNEVPGYYSYKSQYGYSMRRKKSRKVERMRTASCGAPDEQIYFVLFPCAGFVNHLQFQLRNQND